MTIPRFAPCLVACCLLACGNNTDAPPANYGDLLVTFGEQIILPEHRELVTQASGLVSSVQALQQSPDKDKLEAAQAAWRAARKAYRILDGVQLIPDLNLRIAERIDVSPVDPAGIEKLVASSAAVDDAAVSAAGGKKKGFLGLEYLLFPDPAGTGPAPVLLGDVGAARRLALAVGMADEIVASAQELDDAWELDKDGYIAEFEHPSSGARHYFTQLDALNDIIGAGGFALETVVGQRLANPLGRHNGGTADPTLDITTRSDNSVADMQSSLAGFVAVYTFPAFASQVKQHSAALDQQMRSQISASEAALTAIPTPFADAVANHTAIVQAAYDVTKALKFTWNTDVTSALGASYRSEGDGD